MLSYQGSDPPLVYVVLLNWNNSAETIKCIDSINNQSFRNYRILVVDNGSGPHSVLDLEASERVFELVKLPKNRGYSGGCNVGIHHGLVNGASYVWLVNNDAVAEPDALHKLIDFAEANPMVALIAPVVYDLDDRNAEQYSGGWFDKRIPHFELFFGHADALAYQQRSENKLALVGTAMMVRCCRVETIGYLNEDLFAYWEDIEYSIRCIDRGFKTALVDGAVVYHPNKSKITNPSEMKPHFYYYMVRNEILMWRLLLGRWIGFKMALWFSSRQLRSMEHLRSHEGALDAMLAGLWHGVMGRGGPYDPTIMMPRPGRIAFKRFPGILAKVLAKV